MRVFNFDYSEIIFITPVSDVAEILPHKLKEYRERIEDEGLDFNDFCEMIYLYYMCDYSDLSGGYAAFIKWDTVEELVNLFCHFKGDEDEVLDAHPNEQYREEYVSWILS